MSTPSFEEVTALVRSFQSEKRFRHTLSVVKEAEYIAEKCAFSEEEKAKAKLAALLHDITKCFSDEEQLRMIVKYGISEPCEPATVHEKTGAFFARELLGEGLVDSGVFGAVYRHTTGGAGMSKLDMAVFIADCTEETRAYSSCAEVRAYLHAECERLNGEREKAEALLRDVTLMIMEKTMNFLALKRRKIDLRMIEAWNYLVS